MPAVAVAGIAVSLLGDVERRDGAATAAAVFGMLGVTPGELLTSGAGK